MFRLALAVGLTLVGICFAGIVPEQYSEKAGRVVGGSNAVLGQFPYQASILGVLGRTDGANHEVIEILNHPEYNPLFLDNDISLILLTTPLTFGPNVAAVQLSNQHITQGTAIISGWGQTSHPGFPADELQFVSKPIVDNDECRARHLNINAAMIRDNNLCAGGIDAQLNGSIAGPDKESPNRSSKSNSEAPM
ncbi:chymotrypsin-like protease CTRL-1 [Uranotaenia lowii]|uniref:chymotrypsin-like protease CTRL-1 n=1 Tax=Uranotaenia lowii TaxID=190385 RepID=UPI00247955E6|nr:chymotrypsin-like protease CTRL-1 [Uranotaenia lowii]